MAQTHILQRSKSLVDTAPREGKLAPRTLKKKVRLFELIIQNLLLLCGLVSIITTVGILYTLGENSLLFFRRQAFEQTKINTVEPAIVMNMDEAVVVAESISASGTSVPIALGERASQPLATGQILVIGEERMRIRSVSRSDLSVERAYDGSRASAHEAGANIYLHVDKTILLSGELSVSATEIPLPAGSAAAFAGEDKIRIEQEIMRIVSVDEAAATLTVERGVDDTNVVRHHENLPIFITKPVTLTEFFTGTQWNPQLGRLGIWPLLNATLMTTFFALLLALPVGLGIAIYLSEYATARFRSFVKPVLEILVGVPTVVYGYFALTWLTPLLQDLLGVQVKQFNTLSAGLVMGIMIVPTIASISEDALSSVPGSL